MARASVAHNCPMSLSGLRRFTVFSELSPVDLATATAQARKLSLPAGRWLVRPGRELTGSYFLDRGSVRLYEPDAVVEEGSARARLALYPGARGVATLSAVDLLQVDVEALVGVFASVDESTLPLYEASWLTEGWESRFLGAHHAAAATRPVAAYLAGYAPDRTVCR
ncbi:MAG: hypothetical protein O7B25_17470 [Gammaproteobacteria bacterium]|nr:hypothetical protein [Gammaproteobacteria bacterium]